MNSEILKEHLIDDFDMQITYIDDTIKQIEGFDQDLLLLFEKLIKTGEYPDITVEGYNSIDLVEKYSLTKIGSFMMIDWLKKEPQKAKYYLELGI